jgi:hypothetical protein
LLGSRLVSGVVPTLDAAAPLAALAYTIKRVTKPFPTRAGAASGLPPSRHLPKPA